ncbi:hypothetical protein, partial [Human betaherpesvirus 5]
ILRFLTSVPACVRRNSEKSTESSYKSLKHLHELSILKSLSMLFAYLIIILHDEATSQRKVGGEETEQ